MNLHLPENLPVAHDSEAGPLRPGRLWSLWDMLDLNLRNFIEALTELNIAQSRARSLGRDDFAIVPAEEMARVNENLSRVVYECRNFKMPMSLYRISRISVLLSQTNCCYNHLEREIDELFNAVEADARNEYFAHYDKEKSKYVLSAEKEWALIFTNFPSAKREILSGLDCFGLGHNEACVFHMARTAEIALRAIGRSLGVSVVKANTPLEWGTWGQILEEIDKKLSAARGIPNGPKKNEVLKFYSSVLADLRAIQSLYRDQTMHLRDEYSDGEADGAIFRVRDLMAMLSTRIDEYSISPIDWDS